MMSNIQDAIAKVIKEAESLDDTIIEDFLQIAAEQGWRMRRDEVTRQMAEAYGQEARAGPLTGNKQCCFDHKAYRAMLAAAPKFEWRDEQCHEK